MSNDIYIYELYTKVRIKQSSFYDSIDETYVGWVTRKTMYSKLSLQSNRVWKNGVKIKCRHTARTEHYDEDSEIAAKLARLQDGRMNFDIYVPLDDGGYGHYNSKSLLHAPPIFAGIKSGNEWYFCCDGEIQCFQYFESVPVDMGVFCIVLIGAKDIGFS